MFSLSLPAGVFRSLSAICEAELVEEGFLQRLRVRKRDRGRWKREKNPSCFPKEQILTANMESSGLFALFTKVPRSLSGPFITHILVLRLFDMYFIKLHLNLC